MKGGRSYHFWLGASADADPALVSDQAASRLAPTGFDPLRGERPKIVELFGHLDRTTAPLSEGPQLSKAAAERLQQMELLDLQALMDARKNGLILIAGAALAVKA